MPYFLHGLLMHGPYLHAHSLVGIVLTPGFTAINLAYIALLAGALTTAIGRVRILLVLAALFFVAYGLIENIASMTVWNLIIGGLNLYRLIDGWWAEARVSLTSEQETFRRELFAGMTPAEFRSLWALGEDVLCADGVLVQQGVVADRLLLLLRGTVQIRRGEAMLDTMGPGSVIGRLDPDPFSVPAADWVATGAVWLRAWKLADLQRLEPEQGPARWLRSRGPVMAPAIV